MNDKAWETLNTMSQNPSSFKSLIWIIIAITVCVITVIFAITAAVRFMKIKSLGKDGVVIDGEEKSTFYERAIVREQTKAAHNYIRSLEQKCNDLIAEWNKDKNEPLEYGGWKTKCILEYVYDMVVDWITYNHLENSDAYLECKYYEIDSLIYQTCPLPPFRTSEFQERMHRWTKELILHLIKVRQLYKEQMK